eukprot:2228363-Amphidinium_carterae.1
MIDVEISCAPMHNPLHSSLRDLIRQESPHNVSSSVVQNNHLLFFCLSIEVVEPPVIEAESMQLLVTVSNRLSASNSALHLTLLMSGAYAMKMRSAQQRFEFLSTIEQENM